MAQSLLARSFVVIPQLLGDGMVKSLK